MRNVYFRGERDGKRLWREDSGGARKKRIESLDLQMNKMEIGS